MKKESDIQALYGQIRKKAEQHWEGIARNQRPLFMVGTATCGLAQGAGDVLTALRETAGEIGIEVDVMEVGCIGHCYAEPLVVIRMPETPPYLYSKVTPDKAALLLKGYVRDGDPFLPFVMGALEADEMMPLVYDLPRFYFEKRIMLDLCGLIDPDNIDHYIAHRGYEALKNALSMAPEAIVDAIKQSGLRGRGGAGFPTGRKWEICREQEASDRIVICNADEGDPGAYMDRSILESNPHQVIEGLAIAARAIDASRGYIYLRGEYPIAIQRVGKAIKDATGKGLLGENILGSGVDFQLTLFEGSGAFVCGEETALIASIEGERGMPRHRPPFPAEKGFHGLPTLINNVKTLALVTHVIRDSPKTLSSLGTESSKGTMVFSMVGKVEQEGLVEVPMGTTLRELIFDICGGIQDQKGFKAIQIGGPSGGCLPESLLDTPIDYDSLQDAGAMMGSGGMVVMDEDDCMVEVARYFLEFTQGESCGKCTFCRIGTKQMLEILTDITHGKGVPGDLSLLVDLAEDIRMGSLCNLGATAPNPVLTTLRYFQDEYTAHIEEKRCPALQCRELISFYIIPEKCAASCDACVGSCPTEAIYTMRKSRKKAIAQEKCIKCSECVQACPPEYLAVIKISPKHEVPEALEPPPEDKKERPEDEAVGA
jgi:NADH-quinone oxidoreductase subunit F